MRYAIRMPMRQTKNGKLKRQTSSVKTPLSSNMNYSVADAIAAAGGGASGGTAGEISELIPFGIAPGAKVVMRREKAAAEHAIRTGVYVTWRSLKTGEDCARIGLKSRCFCGCSYEVHDFRKGCSLPVCRRCECRGFDFVPSRPEEVGEWWLPRRPGFDASTWRAKCRCGHSHEAHHPSRRSCESCKCAEFSSAYGCVVCDSHQEDHQTRVETAPERTAAGRAVGQDYIPLSQSPELSRLTFGKANHKNKRNQSSKLCPEIAMEADKDPEKRSSVRAGSPSPELLFSSGRITAARYHELLAELDGRRGGGAATK